MPRARAVVPALFGGFVLLAVLTVAGCSGSGGSGVATAGGKGTAASGASPAADPSVRAQQYAQCMAEHGAPQPRAADKDAGDPQAPALASAQAAFEACQQYLGGEVAASPMSAEDIAKMRQFSECVREHGVPDWPDPDPRTGQITFPSDDVATAVKKNPDLPAAMKACEQLSPDYGKGVAGG